ncbi:MAG: DUF4197 domain-containing protein [Sphingomonadales bacterium]|nr:DUF4197 domain-containing protein [Sphingomonadales bacterium]
MSIAHTITRRTMLAGASAGALLGLSGCASYGGYSLVEAVRRLLMLSADNAFARLTSVDGFWNSSVARLALPDVLGRRGAIAEGILTSALFRDRLQHSLNRFAEAGARRAAPRVTEAVRVIGFANAAALLRGSPGGATAALRQEMGRSLVEAMIPALHEVLVAAQDPLVAQTIGALAGVDIDGVATSLADSADNAIWAQMAEEERAIRANPEATRDPVLIAALKVL